MCIKGGFNDKNETNTNSCRFSKVNEVCVKLRTRAPPHPAWPGGERRRAAPSSSEYSSGDSERAHVTGALQTRENIGKGRYRPRVLIPSSVRSSAMASRFIRSCAAHCKLLFHEEGSQASIFRDLLENLEGLMAGGRHAHDEEVGNSMQGYNPELKSILMTSKKPKRPIVRKRIRAWSCHTHTHTWRMLHLMHFSCASNRCRLTGEGEQSCICLFDGFSFRHRVLEPSFRCCSVDNPFLWRSCKRRVHVQRRSLLTPRPVSRGMRYEIRTVAAGCV